jgi:ribosome recycling factor
MPSMVSSVMVDYYGTPTPISQVANVSTPDGMTISIQPWEKSLIPEIEKGIHLANIGFNPMNNGESVIINVPPLTEERRIELVKQAKAEAEETKVGVRNDRKNANNEIKKATISEDLAKNLEMDVQKMTDNHIIKIDAVFSLKEKEIMTV